MTTILDSAAPTDRELVERHLAGDREAFRRIVERHQATVCAVALSAGGDPGRSEDVGQEVFVAAWRQLPALREPEKLRGWLCGIARNLAHAAARRDRRTPTARAEAISEQAPGAGESPREEAARADEVAVMWRALAGIPEIYREPMVLFYREQRSAAAVAAALEISEETVRQRLARGRALLNERMAVLVEETLGRSGPAAGFAGAVMLAVPWGVGPTAAVVVAEAGATGGGVAKTMAAAGAVGGAMAKGGVAVKALSLVAVLPALLGGFEDFIKFRSRQESVTDGRERRRVAWAFLIMQAGIGAAVLLFFYVPERLIEKRTSPVYFVLVGLGIIAAIWTSILAKRRVEKSAPSVLPPLFTKVADDTAPRFENCSARTLLGLPLYHVRLGSANAWRRPVVKGWIAVSDGRALGGLFAMGTGAVAPISMGIGAVGIFTLGVFSIGCCAMGLAAAGWVGTGVVAAGGYAAKGVFVVGGEMASGVAVLAPHCNDAVATAFFEDYGFFAFAHLVGRLAVWSALMGWVMPLVLTGWQLARRKS